MKAVMSKQLQSCTSVPLLREIKNRLLAFVNTMEVGQPLKLVIVPAITC